MLIAQISDLHIRACGRPLHGEIDTEAALRACIGHLLRLQPQPDLILATGDLADLARPADYALLRTYLGQLPMPVFLIPGNHDDRAALAAAFPDDASLPRDGFMHYTVEDWPLRLIGLDTVIPSQIGGGLCAERLRWLADRLAEQPDRPTLLFMHHPPFATGIRFMDTPFPGATELAGVVRGNPQIRQLVCGHLHRAIHHSWAGTTAAIAPSIVYQMNLALNDRDGFFLVHQPPGISLYTWSGEGAPVGYVSLLGFVENKQMAVLPSPLLSDPQTVYLSDKFVLFSPLDDGTFRKRPMTVDLARKYNINVPRYTSYPTAPHFNGSVDAERYRAWLSALAPADPLSLYLHIPFCDEMCWFCGCYTKIVHRYQPIRDYLDALEKEIALVAAALPGRHTLQHVHWGGGSPTMLQAADWQALCDHLRRHFDLAADAELAVELDPRDATEEYIAAVVSAGVNRASIGVQDFDAVVQTAINRHQPYDVVARVCAWLRRHGIDRINLDLMYGLPHQTVDRVVRMVDQAAALTPSRIALFGYAHVPWMKTHQKLIDATTLPSSEERWRQLTSAANRLRELGFVAVGLDHFARPDDGLARALASGRLARNFQGYTTDEASVLIGLGASAIGALPQGYVQNLSPLKEYAQAIHDGRLPTARGRELTADDRMRRQVIQSLMCQLTVDLDATRQVIRPDAAPFAAEVSRLQPYIDDGLVEIDGSQLRITEAGRPFVRLVAAVFDTYLSPDHSRHSRAV